VAGGVRGDRQDLGSAWSRATAALSADADLLLTGNARHWMAARHIELLTSAQLLTRLADEFLDTGASAHQQTASQPDRSSETWLKSSKQNKSRMPRASRSRNSFSVSAG